jgi:CRP-like cAMP-binding protein
MKTHHCKDCPMKSPAAKHLTEQELDTLENNSALVNFKKGELIFKEDALSLNISYLRTGIAKLHMRGPIGDKILRIVKAPAYLGIPTSFGDKVNQFSATALVDTSVCFIDILHFRNFIYDNGRFAYEIIVELCRNELFDYKRSTSQSQKQVPGILAETILCFSEKIYEADQFIFPLTRGEIGDMVGTSRESISRAMTDLVNEGIISFQTKEILIKDKERLRQISKKG